MKLDAYETYCMFTALKYHFTQKNYDYFKYHGKVRGSKDTFASNKNRFKFAKLSRKYDADQLKDFIISNIIAGKSWVGELFDDDAEDFYTQYMKRKQSFTYNFTNEVKALFSSDRSKLFKSTDSQYPEIINKYLQGEISLESIAVLNEFIDFFDKFDKSLGKDDIIWSKIRMSAEKLKPFLSYDKEKLKQVLKDCVT